MNDLLVAYLFPLVLQQELIRFRECLQSFVNSDLIAEQDTDVSTPAVAAMEEEIKRCQNEFVSDGHVCLCHVPKRSICFSVHGHSTWTSASNKLSTYG